MKKKAKTPNLMLLKLAETLECGHCKNIFHGTTSQARHVKYEKAIVYCGNECRHQSQRERFKKRKLFTCVGCGEKFESTPCSAKKYCTQECYRASENFKNIRDNALEKANLQNKQSHLEKIEEQSIECRFCKTVFYRPPHSIGAGFCSRECASKYYQTDEHANDARSSVVIKKPKNYKKFRESGEINCIVEGCGWFGHALSTHMRLAHGFTADEAKMAGGFNISEGLTSKDLREKLADRELVGVALDNSDYVDFYHGNKRSDYVSDESRESQSRAQYRKNDIGADDE